MQKWLLGAAATLLTLGVPVQAKGPTAASYAAHITDAARPEADKARDANRKPAAVLAFAGVVPGMKVVELAPGGGYYTRLLTMAVGSGGKVYTFAGRASPAVEAWASSHPNVTQTIGVAGGVLAPEPVDLVWTTMNYHDFKNAVTDGKDSAARFTEAAFAALKPGGVFLVSDHESAKGTGTSRTSSHHRIESAAVIKEVTAAGFKLAGQSKVLRHPADDLNKALRDSERGQTDQFLLRFVKPKGKR